MHSVSELLKQLEEGQSIAAFELWHRFIDRLIVAARRHVKNLPRRAIDEEDIAITAFEAFLRGAKEGRFKKLENREDLWQVLAMLTERKAIGVMRHELADKRGGATGRGDSVFERLLLESSSNAGIDQVSDPNPAMIEFFTIEVRELLEGLGDELLQRLVMLKLEGYNNDEAARLLQISLRAVERKLRLIRSTWTEDGN